MLAALLALSLAQGAAPATSRLDRLEAAPAGPAVSVILDCQVLARALTDCKAVNAVSDSGTVAEAIRMAAAIVVPQGLAESGVERIKVKMNVTP
jgi:hypothetical protein